MIDTHLHILPGIDDGPETLQESVELARVLIQEGIHTAIATPHYNDMYPKLSAMEIQERVINLQRALDHHKLPLRLFAGHEVLIKPGLVEDIQTGRIATLNGSRYLLLELWNSAWLPETERVIFELIAFGIIPVVAHVERYRAIQQHPHRLVTLLEQGVLTQLTANSLMGIWGKTTQRLAETSLTKGLIHCIASDAHDLHRRPLGISGGLQRAAELLGQAHIKHMIETLPAIIIKNEAYSR
jgi:protein-tyrosine phosphatase